MPNNWPLAVKLYLSPGNVKKTVLLRNFIPTIDVTTSQFLAYEKEQFLLYFLLYV